MTFANGDLGSRCRHEFCYLCRLPYRDIRSIGNHAHEQSCAHYRPVSTPSAERANEPFELGGLFAEADTDTDHDETTDLPQEQPAIRTEAPRPNLTNRLGHNRTSPEFQPRGAISTANSYFPASRITPRRPRQQRRRRPALSRRI